MHQAKSSIYRMRELLAGPYLPLLHEHWKHISGTIGARILPGTPQTLSYAINGMQQATTAVVDMLVLLENHSFDA